MIDVRIIIVYNGPVHAPAPVFGGDAGSFVFYQLKLTLFLFNGPAALTAFSNTWAGVCTVLGVVLLKIKCPFSEF
jgi:hypothetical protein